jgi:hypothetical protein
MISTSKLHAMLQLLAATREDEIGCSDCWDQLDCFVEQLLAGRQPAELMPLVQQHIEMCGDCREEYEALREALAAGQQPPGDDPPP